MACVIANQRSNVIIVNVKIDKWLANTVKNPAALHPDPKQNVFIRINYIEHRQQRTRVKHKSVSDCETV